jgi:dihydroflavonol-4-reductase
MTRRVFVTGAAGFIGGAIVRNLRTRGDAVVAVVRDPTGPRAVALREIGVELSEGDLDSESAIRRAMAGCDAVIHGAGIYRIGIQTSERPAMYEANVTVAERVFDAATALAIQRIVAISSVNVLGDTGGVVADETFRRDLAAGYLSYYDETKVKAHLAAEARIDAGAPLVIVMPGTTYGPDDHSPLGAQLEAAFVGQVRFTALGDTGISPAHVDDIAAGIVAATERGRVGESYILAGENLRLREAIAIAARAGGHRPPRLDVPNGVLRFGARLAPGAGRMFGLSPNLGEILDASAGVTYWASSAKAAAELGYRSRDLATGARDAFGRA